MTLKFEGYCLKQDKGSSAHKIIVNIFLFMNFIPIPKI